MALFTTCNRCGVKISYGSKMCDKCYTAYDKEKTIKNAQYDRYRSKEVVDFYKSKAWLILTDIVKEKYKYLDLYSYYVLGKIEYGNIVHHIELFEDNQNKRLDINNLIYLTTANHNMIHALYNKNNGSKIATQQLLFNLIEKWNEDMNKNE